MLRKTHDPLAWTLLVLAPLGCGARTTLDESFGGQAGSTSAGGSPAGSGGIAGSAGFGGGGISGSGGVAGSGIGGVAGTGIGGSGPGGSAGSAGSGGEPSPGRLRQACRDLCRPYSEVCPTEFQSVEDCTRDCVDSINDTPAACRGITANALECLGAWISPKGTCDDALTNAALYCQDELLEIDRCDDAPRPIPPDDCSGTATSTPEQCSVNLYCSNGTYWVECQENTPGSSQCLCASESAASTLTVYGPGGDACSEALVRCGFAI